MHQSAKALTSVSALSIVGLISAAHAATQTETFSLAANQGGGVATRALSAPATATNLNVLAQQSGFAVTVSGAGATCSSSGSAASCTLSGASALTVRVTNNRACSFFGLVCSSETTQVSATWTLPDAPPPPPPPSPLEARVGALETQIASLTSSLSAAHADIAALEQRVDELDIPGASRVLAQGTASLFDDAPFTSGDTSRFTARWSPPVEGAYTVSHWRIRLADRDVTWSDRILAESFSHREYCSGTPDTSTGEAVIICYDRTDQFPLNETTGVEFVILGQ